MVFPTRQMTRDPGMRRLALGLLGLLIIAVVVGASIVTRSASADMVLIVTSTADNTTADGSCTLREAIGVVNGTPNADCAVSGSTSPFIIQFDTNVFSDGTVIELDPSLLASFSHFTLTGVTPVVIEWTGTGEIVLDANATDEVAGRHFRVSADATLTLNGLALVGGNLTGADLSSGTGGSVFNEGTLTVLEGRLEGTLLLAVAPSTAQAPSTSPIA